jgi:AraC-like DNA-binding protein
MRTADFDTSDLGEAQEVLRRYFTDSTVEVLEGPRNWRARMTLSRTPEVTVGVLNWSSAVRLRFASLGAYHVDVPGGGSLHWRQAGAGEHVADKNSAAVFHPDGELTIDRWTGGNRLIALRMNPDSVEEQLRRRIRGPMRQPLRFGPLIDTTHGAAASWRRLLSTVAEDLGQPQSLANHPITGPLLHEALIVGLLLVADHPYRDQLDDASDTIGGAASFRKAVDAIRSEPTRAFTIAALSDIAGVGPRTLQKAFQTRLGMTPTAYARQVRLERAHEELRCADQDETTVAKVADKYGFLHLGRFAGMYRQRYGQTPSETLRHPRHAR